MKFDSLFLSSAVVAACLIASGLTSCTKARVAHREPGRIETSESKASVFSGQVVLSGEESAVADFFNNRHVAFTVKTVDKDLVQVNFDAAALSVDQVVNGLKRSVDFIEPNFLLTTSVDSTKWPKDAEFLKLWGLNNVGQSAPAGLEGSAGADIGTVQAWTEFGRGSKDIVVGVVDTGVDYLHPDLLGNIWVNEKEKAGSPGIDDDGNGYVDDIYGWDFVSEGRENNNLGKPGDNDPMDDNGHGTHCSGTIGAVGDNGLGVVGVNWNVSIMPLKFLDANGSGGTVDAYRAILYGVEQGANILSNSWGGGGKSKLLERAIKIAQERGVLFVAAAGNDSSDNDVASSYPANYEVSNVLSVGASDNNDTRAYFSNYGQKSVHIFAPGVNILSTIPRLKNPNYPYATFSGTSMATPHVAGAAALLLSVRKELVGKPEQIKEALMTSSDVVQSLGSSSISSGRLNIYRALKADRNAPSSLTFKEEAYAYKSPAHNVLLTDVRHTIKRPGAKALKIHFDFVQVDEPYDSVYLYDGFNNLVATFATGDEADYWSPVVPGDTATVRFVNSKVSEASVNQEYFPTEEDGLKAGAQVCFPEGDGFLCAIPGDAREYVTFNSEGFAIDKIAVGE